MTAPLEDPAGHLWRLAEAVADVAPEDFGCETVSPWKRLFPEGIDGRKLHLVEARTAGPDGAQSTPTGGHSQRQMIRRGHHRA